MIHSREITSRMIPHIFGFPVEDPDLEDRSVKTNATNERMPAITATEKKKEEKRVWRLRGMKKVGISSKMSSAASRDSPTSTPAADPLMFASLRFKIPMYSITFSSCLMS